MGNRKEIKRGMLGVISDFRKNPSKVWYDSLNNIIGNRKTYKISDQEAIDFLRVKIAELKK